MTDSTAPSIDPLRDSSGPDRLWTVINVGEARPDNLSPLCLSLGDVGGPGAPNHWIATCFFVGQAMNIE